VRRCTDLKFQVSVLIFRARTLGFSTLRSPRLWFQCYRVLPAPQLIFPVQHAADFPFGFIFAAISGRLKLVPGSSCFISPDFHFYHRSSRLTHPAGSLYPARVPWFSCVWSVLPAREVHRTKFLFGENFLALPGSRFSRQCISLEFMLPAHFPFHRSDLVLILAFVATTGTGGGLLFSLSTPAPAKCAYTKA
jgi:hypothetical protein